MFRISLLAVGLVALSACVPDPKNYETTPVTVNTELGPVTCQLYTKDVVRWDRSIDRPVRMSVEQADQICLAEGARRKKG